MNSGILLSDSVWCLVCQALVARLTDGTGVGSNNGIISGVLVTVGDLARVVGIIGFYSLWRYRIGCSKINFVIICLQITISYNKVNGPYFLQSFSLILFLAEIF